MSSIRYQHGPTPAVSSESLAVLLGIADDDPRVDRVLELADAGSSADDVLDLLVLAGVRSMPDFALCERLEQGWRVLLRGAFEAVLDAGQPLVPSSGPWLELVAEASTITLRRSDASDGGRLLPIRGGVVLSSALVISAEGKEPAAHRAGQPVGGATRARPGDAGSKGTVPSERTDHPGVLTAPMPPAASAPEASPAHGAAEAEETSAAEETARVIETPGAVEPEAASVAGPEVPVQEPPAPEASPEGSGEFDFLFGATSARPQRPAEPAAPIDSAPEPAAESVSPALPDAQTDASWTRPSPLTIDRDLLVEDVASPPPPVAGRLITAFPWALDSDNAAPASPVATPSAPVSASASLPPIPSLIAGPHVDPHAQQVAADASPGSVSTGASDELGIERTINRAHLLGQGPVVPNVLAARCPAGHLSPGFAAECRVCRQPIMAQTPFETPRPRLGLLRLSTGAVVTLDRGAILGRNPRVPSDYSGEQPNLVRVVDSEKSMSSQHLEVTLDYWNVNVRDLGSTNGTVVVLPGAMPLTLRAGSPVILEPGSRVIMGGTVTFVFEVTP